MQYENRMLSSGESRYVLALCDECKQIVKVNPYQRLRRTAILCARCKAKKRKARRESDMQSDDSS